MKILHKAALGNSLTEQECYEYATAILKGEVSDIELASFLTALKINGETAEELFGFVRAVREAALPRTGSYDFDFLDTCGTGGDEKGSINISTISALLLGSMGIKVAKHGNRSVSSLCGSSDFLESFGYNIHVPAEKAEKRFFEKGFTFLFAPVWHSSMKNAANVRKTLGFRTIFNLIGPLCNPLNPTHQIIGVYSPELLEKMILVLKKQGTKKAILCCSKDGFDEFSLFSDTDYLLLEDGKISAHTFNVSSLHLPSLRPSEIFAETKEASVALSERIMKGENLSGTHAVALNAGAALYLFGKSESIEAGYRTALAELLTGRTWNFLQDAALVS